MIFSFYAEGQGD